MSLFTKDKSINSKTNITEIKTANSSRLSSAGLLKNEAIVTSPKSNETEQFIKSVNDATFSDLYITPDKKCYVASKNSNNGLMEAQYTDLKEFVEEVINKYNGDISSYSLYYKGGNYRVERTIALEGEQYCVRKMPKNIPDLERLGFQRGIYNQLLSIGKSTGLVLLTGATGAGKSTTIASIIKKYLQTEGGYAFTIEDPIEMPLDGVYKMSNGDLGLCKQTTPPNGSWAEGIKSALRSKPRYIYVGEIRTPAAAVELLRASTSGHLVFSTIHGNNTTDAINALAKYAASSGISEEMSYELIANGLLACIHQTLKGNPKKLTIEAVFANPNQSAGCQVRGMIRTGKLNLNTIIEQQRSRLNLGLSLFE